MKKTLTSYLLIHKKKYFFSLSEVSAKTTLIKCEAANIEQEFLNEDVPPLLNDLPHLILAEKIHKEQRDEIIRFRVKPEDKKQIEKIALAKGYPSVSQFLRDLALKSM